MLLTALLSLTIAQTEAAPQEGLKRLPLAQVDFPAAGYTFTPGLKRTCAGVSDG